MCVCEKLAGVMHKHFPLRACHAMCACVHNKHSSNFELAELQDIQRYGAHFHFMFWYFNVI